MTRRQDEGGQVTVFVVVVFVALLAMAGLVIDGGTALAAKRRAIDEAESAARAGAQALSVDAYRTTQTLSLDQSAARAAALAYLAATGDTGQVTITDGHITVTVTVRQPVTILGAFGVDTMTLTGTGTAHLLRGVEEPQ